MKTNIVLTILVVAAVVILVMMVMRRKHTEGFAKPMKRLSDDPNMSFLSGMNYSQQEYVSDPRWIQTCKDKCSSDDKCYGFFEQTHLCPEPKADDHVSNPNNTPGKGCYRVCGFYDRMAPTGDNKLSGGPTGSVWMKDTSFMKDAATAKKNSSPKKK
jgi:hypothetical protein